ncbi:MAG TPA: hypothetical protein VHP14_01670 [Anaerolineales bacterium]|nr:hypothetical protein [Anaerolineales bacterium]
MNTLSNSLTRERVGENVTFSAPLGDLKAGRLEVTSGVANLELYGDRSTRDLFHAEFRGLIPEVRLRNERVNLHYHFGLGDFLQHILWGNRDAGDVALNTSIAWQIELRGGVSNLDADLRELRVSSLTITGGISNTDLLLPPPTGTVQIHLASGVSNLKVFRPQGVPARLKVGGGISHMAFDDQTYSSVGGGLQLETPDYKTATDRYDIVLGGGVSNLVVRAQA